MMADLAFVWTGIKAGWWREIRAYFATPLAYLFLAIFLFTLGAFTWDVAGFFDTGAADLTPFFTWHPWLYLLFMPALAMRLWAEESLSGTQELLLSLPVSLPGLVIGKLLAAWSVAGLALVLTFPWWISVNYLGPADNSSIALSYAMSWIMAGAYLSLGSMMSALTRSAVIAFVLGVLGAFALTAAGWPVVTTPVAQLFGLSAAETLAAFSFLTHFETAQRGVLEVGSLFYFLSVISLMIALNTILVLYRRRSGR